MHEHLFILFFFMNIHCIISTVSIFLLAFQERFDALLKKWNLKIVFKPEHNCKQ